MDNEHGHKPEEVPPVDTPEHPSGPPIEPADGDTDPGGGITVGGPPAPPPPPEDPGGN